MSQIWKTLLGSLVAVACFGAGTWGAVIFEKRAPSARGGGARDLIYLPTPEQARLMSLGYTGVVADYYWVKALQYFTDPSQRVNRYKNLADYLEIVVGIDPEYRYAYKFAGISIPYDSGRYRFVNTRRSTSFLERGVQRFPSDWQLRLFLGYNYLNYHDEPLKAAEQFAAASKLPGAPTYLAAFAARVWTVGGEIDRALEFANATLQSATDPEIRQLMKTRVLDLEVEKELRRIEAAAKDFQSKNSRLPADVQELVASGFAPPPPGFTLDREGVAHSSIKTERMVIYQDSNQPDFGGD